jgi:hypothetical protein
MPCDARSSQVGKGHCGEIENGLAGRLAFCSPLSPVRLALVCMTATSTDLSYIFLRSSPTPSSSRSRSLGST